MASRLNVLILAAYVTNFGLTFLSQTGAYGKTNAEVSRLYQSLATPAGWAFSIWGLIFSLQTVYAVAQLLPAYHDAEEVQRAGPWFIGTCLLQAAWSIAFGKEQIVLAQVLICAILGTLWRVNVELHAIRTASAPKWPQYLLFHLPFAIHFGWLTAATTVGLNLTCVYMAPHGHAFLLSVAILSLVGVVLPACIDPLTGRTGADPPYALTIAWALSGIRSQLSHPLTGAPEADPITRWCPQLVTDALASVAAVLAAGIVSIVLTRIAMQHLLGRACERPGASARMRDALVIGAGEGVEHGK